MLLTRSLAPSFGRALHLEPHWGETWNALTAAKFLRSHPAASDCVLYVEDQQFDEFPDLPRRGDDLHSADTERAFVIEPARAEFGLHDEPPAVPKEDGGTWKIQTAGNAPPTFGGSV